VRARFERKERPSSSATFFFNPYASEGDGLFLYREHLRARGHGVRAMKRLEDCRRRVLSYEALFEFFETKDRSEVRNGDVESGVAPPSPSVGQEVNDRD